METFDPPLASFFKHYYIGESRQWFLGIMDQLGLYYGGPGPTIQSQNWPKNGFFLEKLTFYRGLLTSLWPHFKTLSCQKIQGQITLKKKIKWEDVRDRRTLKMQPKCTPNQVSFFVKPTLNGDLWPLLGLLFKCYYIGESRPWFPGKMDQLGVY